MESSKAYQNILVMRHGDRMDKFDPNWVWTAAKPWDPPLVQEGLTRAFRTGLKIRSQIDFPIHRVFVSPFLRCLQTASEVISALAAFDADLNAISSKDVASIDESKFKVAIEYGLCETLNTEAIRRELAPKDGNFGFNISDLEATFPSEMVDPNVDRVYKELPQWEEPMESCRARYLNVVNSLADRYPSENLLLVTHGEGVGTVFSTFSKDVIVHDVGLCAWAKLRRQVSNADGSLNPGEFEAITSLGQAGIRYSTTGLKHDPNINQTTV